jgi:hypothetical protein
MTLSFPLSLASFADTIGISTVKWLLQDNRELSGLGSGQILQADLAPRLFVGDVGVREMYHVDASRIEAKLDAMVDAQGSFYLYDPRRRGPFLDPDGAILGAADGTINSLPDARSMSLSGLPAAYKLVAGDYLHYDYGDPARRAFHRIVEDITANGSGVTPAFTVAPYIRPGAATGLSVTLVKPAMKCIIRPGSIDVQGTGNGTTIISFSVVQKL